MKRNTLRRIAAFLLVIVVLSVAMVSCGKKTKLSGTYYYDYGYDGKSEGDIELYFYNENSVSITTYEEDDYYDGYYYNNYYNNFFKIYTT